MCQEYDTDFYLYLSGTSRKIDSFYAFFWVEHMAQFMSRISPSQEIAHLDA